MDQDWTRIVKDFHGLASEVVNRIRKYGVIKAKACDKRTLDHWLEEGAQPQTASPVASFLRLALQQGIDTAPYQTFTPIYDFSPGLTYELQAESGPPPLEWLSDYQSLPRPRLTRYCGVEADCPVGIASSPIVNDDRWTSTMLGLGFGISTLKTRRARPKKAYDPPLIGFVVGAPDLSRYDASNPPTIELSLKREDGAMPIPDMVNSIGVPSEAPGVWEEIYERVKQHPLGGTVGLSILGDGENKAEVLKAFDELAARARSLRPPFLECNVSCPNLEKRPSDIFRDPSFMLDVCRTVKQVMAGSSTALVLKLPWLEEADLRKLIPKVASHINGVALKNTVRVRPVRRDRDGDLQPAFPGIGREFGGLSGPSTRNLTKRGVRSLVRIKEEGRYDFHVMAIGGICETTDVVELLNLGADAVQACTAPMFDPLLAWKVRFHLAHVKHNIRNATSEEQILLPRDHRELRCYVNLQSALRVIRSRSGAYKVPDSAVTKKWNEWMQQPATHLPHAEGLRNQTRRERSVDEWIRILMPQRP